MPSKQVQRSWFMRIYCTLSVVGKISLFVCYACYATSALCSQKFHIRLWSGWSSSDLWFLPNLSGKTISDSTYVSSHTKTIRAKMVDIKGENCIAWTDDIYLTWVVVNGDEWTSTLSHIWDIDRDFANRFVSFIKFIVPGRSLIFEQSQLNRYQGKNVTKWESGRRARVAFLILAFALPSIGL